MKRIVVIIFGTIMLSSLIFAATQKGVDYDRYSTYTFTIINDSNDSISLGIYDNEISGTIRFYNTNYQNTNNCMVLPPHSRFTANIVWQVGSTSRSCRLAGGFTLNGAIAEKDMKYPLVFTQTYNSIEKTSTREFSTYQNMYAIKYTNHTMKITNSTITIVRDISFIK